MDKDSLRKSIKGLCVVALPILWLLGLAGMVPEGLSMSGISLTALLYMLTDILIGRDY